MEREALRIYREERESLNLGQPLQPPLCQLKKCVCNLKKVELRFTGGRFLDVKQRGQHLS